MLPMAAHEQEPSGSPEELAFTKGEVDRAGQILRRWYARDRAADTEDLEAGPDGLAEATIAVTWWRGLHARPLSRVAADLRRHVGAEVPGRIDVTQRLKRRPTIADKLEREPGMRLTRMQDIGGVRATLPSLAQLEAVSGRLHDSGMIARTKDYVAEPRSSGYRAVHHVVRSGGLLLEVQLRTIRQDAWANQVEEDGRRLRVGYKFGAGEAEVHDYYRLFSEAFAALDEDRTLGPDLITAVKDGRARVGDMLLRPTSGGENR
jgi:putative GTP pyrophosphokinase